MMIEHHEIRTVLPQRYPLLLIDRVLELEPGKSIRAIKTVTANEPCYSAIPEHSPRWRFRYPTSLLIESLGQAAALLWLHGAENAVDADHVLLFVGARNYEIHGAAYPGDTLFHRVDLDCVVADTAFAAGTTWVGDRCIARVETLMAARRPSGALGNVNGSVPATGQITGTPRRPTT